VALSAPVVRPWHERHSRNPPKTLLGDEDLLSFSFSLVQNHVLNSPGLDETERLSSWTKDLAFSIPGTWCPYFIAVLAEDSKRIPRASRRVRGHFLLSSTPPLGRHLSGVLVPLHVRQAKPSTWLQQLAGRALNQMLPKSCVAARRRQQRRRISPRHRVAQPFRYPTGEW